MKTSKILLKSTASVNSYRALSSTSHIASHRSIHSSTSVHLLMLSIRISINQSIDLKERLLYDYKGHLFELSVPRRRKDVNYIKFFTQLCSLLPQDFLHKNQLESSRWLDHKKR
ncbi:uncharacterized protein LOC119632376 [Glossina fuscipes]|uniref:Uncharacterized protein LOC119632376 n=1 Tax=Glossina fuscipes TaxID=7396 RepID=A0A8U0W7D6_9MUSC|nr:uncharacterized protein LOC119632376 [Glossina fuscipes]